MATILPVSETNAIARNEPAPPAHGFLHSRIRELNSRRRESSRRGAHKSRRPRTFIRGLRGGRVQTGAIHHRSATRSPTVTRSRSDDQGERSPLEGRPNLARGSRRLVPACPRVRAGDRDRWLEQVGVVDRAADHAQEPTSWPAERLAHEGLVDRSHQRAPGHADPLARGPVLLLEHDLPASINGDRKDVAGFQGSSS